MGAWGFDARGPEALGGIAMTSIEKLNWMIEHCNSVSINANDHRGNYETVAQEFESSEMLVGVDPAVRADCIRLDRIIICQVYPRTPIGFEHTVGTSVDEVINEMFALVGPPGE